MEKCQGVACKTADDMFIKVNSPLPQQQYLRSLPELLTAVARSSHHAPASWRSRFAHSEDSSAGYPRRVLDSGSPGVWACNVNASGLGWNLQTPTTAQTATAIASTVGSSRSAAYDPRWLSAPHCRRACPELSSISVGSTASQVGATAWFAFTALCLWLGTLATRWTCVRSWSLFLPSCSCTHSVAMLPKVCLAFSRTRCCFYLSVSAHLSLWIYFMHHRVKTARLKTKGGVVMWTWCQWFARRTTGLETHEMSARNAWRRLTVETDQFGAWIRSRRKKAQKKKGWELSHVESAGWNKHCGGRTSKPQENEKGREEMQGSVGAFTKSSGHRRLGRRCTRAVSL